MDIRLDKLADRVTNLERFTEKIKHGYQEFSIACKHVPHHRPKSGEMRSRDSSYENLSRWDSDRALDMEKALTVKSSDPPLTSIPLTPVITFLLALVTQVMNSKTPIFPSRVIKNLSVIKELFTSRDGKAKQKYGHSLSLEDNIDGLEATQNKLADALFLLTKMKETRKKNFPLTNEQIKQLDTIRDLQKLLTNMLQEIK
jgi:hypothetical protein